MNKENTFQIIRRFKNKYSKNTAYIDFTYIYPYDGATETTTAFRSVCMDSNGYIYSVSVRESIGDCLVDLERMGFIVG